jgi:uncharacterized protein YbjT (DUF2867 family)
MAMFSQNMLELALILAEHDPSYENDVQEFFERFFWIAAAVDPIGDLATKAAAAGLDIALYAKTERAAARAFADMARDEGVGRVVYLGGLGDDPTSEHLRSRQQTGEILAEHGPPLTWFRAAMVVGAGSESYRTLRYLVERLPAMIAPAWIKTPTQPIGIDDVAAYLAAAPHVDGSAGREVEIGGPDVVSYGDMLDLMAYALGRRPRPKLPVPLITPRLSSRWIGLVTPVDAGVARPLVEGLSTPTVVHDYSGMDLFDVDPRPLSETLARAVAETEAAAA